MSVRKFYLTRALTSYPSLGEVINELTEDEVIAALELEAATRRRKSIIDRLIARAARLHEIQYVANLKEKFHGTSQLEDPHPR